MSLTRRIFPFIVALCLAFAPGRQAAAHALVVESSPAIDGSVVGPQVDITLRFNSRLDHQRSRLTLIGPDGTEHRLALSPADAPDILQAKATDVTPGAYKLRWQVLAIDGHITRGDIPFRVTQP
jgi:methionine-rich copper-binding protein CopC